MRTRKKVVLAAGGTGGHLFPALSVARVWSAKGTPVVLFTDERAQTWAESPDKPWRVVVSRFTGKSAQHSGRWGRIVFGLRLLACGFKSLASFILHRPAVVVGFGGYPSAPVVLAARMLRIPYVLHECNASLGRANEILLSGAKALTLGFDVEVPQAAEKGIPVLFTGNPVREEIAHLAEHFETANENDRMLSEKQDSDVFRLFVVGGSQGSRLFSKVVPEALRILCSERPELRLEIHEQVRINDLSEVQAFYQKWMNSANISVDLRPFFNDMPEQLSRAHLVIARSGALTLSEIAAAGCPSLLVPLACTVSNDQPSNAERFRQRAAAIVLEESVFSPRHLCFVLNTLFQAPEALSQMRASARSLFTPHASERLVDQAERVGSF